MSIKVIENHYYHKYKSPSGYVGYRVGHDGTVWSCWTRGTDPVPCDDWRLMKGRQSSSGHLIVTLCNGQNRRHVGIHVLVAELFLPPPREDQWQVRHLDGDPANNAAWNLAWGNQSENEGDKIRHGTKVLGSAKPNAKLNEHDIPEIRALLSQGWTGRALAARYGVTTSIISRINMGTSWRHVV